MGTERCSRRRASNEKQRQIRNVMLTFVWSLIAGKIFKQKKDLVGFVF